MQNGMLVLATALAGPPAFTVASRQTGAPDATATLTIQPAQLVRGEARPVHVTIHIPPDWWLVGETTDDLQGASLVIPRSPGPTSLAGPTWPRPAFHRVAPLNRDVLAYRGDIDVMLPVFVPPGIFNRTTVKLALTYELCRGGGCEPRTIANASAALPVDEPQDVAEKIAFRVDSRRAAILLGTDSDAERDNELPKIKTAAKLLDSISLVPPERPASVAQGTAWAIRSDGNAYAARSEQLGVADGPECGRGITSLAIVSADDPQFVRDRGTYFVATHVAEDALASPSLRLALHLTSSARHELEATIERQIRVTFPSLFGPRNGRFSAPLPAPQRVVDYDVQAFQLAPDGYPRLFVRTVVSTGRGTMPGPTLWIRMEHDRFVVEASDGWAASMSEYHLFEGIGSKLADWSTLAGVVLNVAAFPNNTALLIMWHAGYESSSIQLFRYSPDGPMAVGTPFKRGC